MIFWKSQLAYNYSTRKNFKSQYLKTTFKGKLFEKKDAKQSWKIAGCKHGSSGKSAYFFRFVIVAAVSDFWDNIAQCP